MTSGAPVPLLLIHQQPRTKGTTAQHHLPGIPGVQPSGGASGAPGRSRLFSSGTAAFPKRPVAQVLGTDQAAPISRVHVRFGRGQAGPPSWLCGSRHAGQLRATLAGRGLQWPSGSWLREAVVPAAWPRWHQEWLPASGSRLHNVVGTEALRPPHIH